MCTVLRFLFCGVQNVRVLRADVRTGRPVFLPRRPPGWFSAGSRGKSCRKRLPSQGPIPPIRGKCPEGTKGVGMLSPKVTERLLHICGDLSVSASPSHLPWEGRPWGTHSKASPMRGSCRRRRLMRWGGSCVDEGQSTSSVSASPCHLPLVGEGMELRPRKKSALPGREGRWGWEFTRYRGSCTCCGG